jgi:GntR family transcriptional regulator/GntR family frlABCD operon transcriptional regulator
MKIPLYKKLHSILREHIITGLYKEGDLLPSENELCLTHNVTRPTVRQALNELVREGYINKHHGKGSIVAIPSKEAGILSIQGTSSAIGKGLRTKIITKPHIAKWDDPFFFELSNHEMESGCIKMERIRLINDVPVFYETTFLPNIHLSGFCQRNFENKSLFKILSKYYGIEVRGGKQRFRAINAQGKIAKYLQIQNNKPILHLERKMVTNKTNFNFYCSLYCNTKHYTLSGDF